MNCACAHSLLQNGVALAACRWSKIWTAILVQLSVVSHNTQKGVVRRKLCRFSSKLSPEVLSFVSYACLKFCVERRSQNWRFSLRFSPHGYSNVRLLVFLWTARQCKSICSLVVGFCRLFACIIPWSKTQLFKNFMAIPKYGVLPHCDKSHEEGGLYSQTNLPWLIPGTWRVNHILTKVFVWPSSLWTGPLTSLSAANPHAIRRTLQNRNFCLSNITEYYGEILRRNIRQASI